MFNDIFFFSSPCDIVTVTKPPCRRQKITALLTLVRLPVPLRHQYPNSSSEYDSSVRSYGCTFMPVTSRYRLISDMFVAVYPMRYVLGSVNRLLSSDDVSGVTVDAEFICFLFEPRNAFALRTVPFDVSYWMKGNRTLVLAHVTAIAR